MSVIIKKYTMFEFEQFAFLSLFYSFQTKIEPTKRVNEIKAKGKGETKNQTLVYQIKRIKIVICFTWSNKSNRIMIVINQFQVLRNQRHEWTTRTNYLQKIGFIFLDFLLSDIKSQLKDLMCVTFDDSINRKKKSSTINNNQSNVAIMIIKKTEREKEFAAYQLIRCYYVTHCLIFTTFS